MNIKTTLNEITALSIKDRISLVQAIWNSIALEQAYPDFTEGQKRQPDHLIDDEIIKITLPETDVEMQQFPILLGQGGEIIIPQLLQNSLKINQGSMLVLLQIGNLILLSPKQPQAPQLIDQIATIMEKENVGLADLLGGLETEREVIWQEQQS